MPSAFVAVDPHDGGAIVAAEVGDDGDAGAPGNLCIGLDEHAVERRQEEEEE